MTNLKVRDTAALPPGTGLDTDDVDIEGGLAALRGDCARMVPHWVTPPEGSPRPVPPSLIHGVVVPPGSARLLDAMSDYGD